MMNFSVPSRGLLALTVMVASAAAQADQTVAKRGAPRVEVEFVEYQNDGQVIALGARGQKRISGGNETLSANQEGRGKGQVAGGKGQNMAGVGPGDLLDPYGNAGDFGMGPSPSPNPKDLYPNAPGTTGMGGYGGYGMGYGGYGYDPYMMGGGYGMGYGGYGMMGYGMMRPCIMVGPDGQQITDRICQAERIVNLGKRVFDWIREGTATYNERQDYATAVPESVESWEDLEEWAEEPLQTIQGLRYSAYLSDRIVRAEIKWAVQCSWGGRKKDGTGRYAWMTVRPIQTDVGWAVDMDATAETVRIANVGKNGHSVGQVTMQLNISAGNFLRRHNTKITYSCQGDGKLRYVNGLEGVSPAQD